MLKTLSTLLRGISAKSEDAVQDHFAIELIDQKIKDGTTNLQNAKSVLAGLIQRERTEAKQIQALDRRIEDLMERARAALAAKENDLAEEAAQAIATLEDEAALRKDAIAVLGTKITRLRASVEASHRRIVDLKQNAALAKSIRHERNAEMRLSSSRGEGSALQDAEAMVAKVLDAEDPVETRQIAQDIDDELDQTKVVDRLAAKGFGKPTKTTAQEVLQRLMATPKTA